MPSPERRVRNGRVRWYARYRDPAGRSRSRTFDRKVDAQRFLDEKVVSVRRGTYVDDRGVTFGVFTEGWLAGLDVNPSTREAMRARLDKHVLPTLGSHRLASMRVSTIREWMVTTTSLAPSYRRLLLGHVAHVLDAAVEDQLLGRNPARAQSIAKARPSGRGRKVVPWSADQVRAVQAALPEQYRILVALGAGLGLRQGELFGLSPDDVGEGVVRVRRQVKVFGGNRLVLGHLKADEGDGAKARDVPLPDTVREALERHLAEHPAREVTLPWGEPGGVETTVKLVATTREGGALNRNYVNQHVWKPALRTAGIEPSRENGMHALRHHYASVLLDAGESVRAVADFLGHQDPALTLRVYAHLMPSSNERARNAVDRIWRVPDVYPDGPATL